VRDWHRPRGRAKKVAVLGRGGSNLWLKGRVLRRQNAGGNPTALGISEAEVTVPRDGKTYSET
jgi:hypothetical protein